jgi:FkbM family methyltransferase
MAGGDSLERPCFFFGGVLLLLFFVHELRGSSLFPRTALRDSPQPAAPAAAARFQYLATPERYALAGGGGGAAGATAATEFSVPPWVFAAPGALPVLPPLPPAPLGDAARAFTKAQDYEDVHAHLTYFAGVRGKLILESGALDGVQFSVSNFFVKAMGWRAIHVEASPPSFAKLRENRPEALNIHTAVCSRDAPLHYVTDGSRGPVNGFWEFMSDNLKNAYWPKADVNSMPLVPCRPLGPLLSMFGVTHIDLWVLDVEGAELEVLKTFDFKAITVDVVCIEQDGGNPEKDKAVRELMKKEGYELDLMNQVCVQLRGMLRAAARVSFFHTPLPPSPLPPLLLENSPSSHTTSGETIGTPERGSSAHLKYRHDHLFDM